MEIIPNVITLILASVIVIVVPFVFGFRAGFNRAKEVLLKTYNAQDF